MNRPTDSKSASAAELEVYTIDMFIGAGLTFIFYVILAKLSPETTQAFAQWIKGDLEESQSYLAYLLLIVFALSSGLTHYLMTKKTFIIDVVKGNMLISGRDAFKEMYKLDKKDIKQSPGLKFGDWTIPTIREVAHILLAALPGSGKSAIMLEAVRQAVQRGHKVVVTDPKGEVTSHIYSMVEEYTGRKVAMIDPSDMRNTKIMLGNMFKSTARIKAFNDMLFLPDSGDDKNKYFNSGASALSTGLCMLAYKKHGMNTSFEHIADEFYAESPEELVRRAIQGSLIGDKTFLAARLNMKIEPGQDIADEDVVLHLEKSAGEIVSTLQQKATFIQMVGAASREAKDKIDLYDFIDNDEYQALILKTNLEFKDSYAEYFNLVFSMLQAKIANSNEIPHDSKDKGIWFILDEFFTLTKQSANRLNEMMALLRSRGVRVIVALQDNNQLASMMEKADSEAFKSMFKTIIIGQVSSGSATTLSKESGTVIARLTIKNHGREGDVTESKDLPTISEEDITGLRVENTMLENTILKKLFGWYYKRPHGVDLITVMNGHAFKIRVPFAQCREFDKDPANIDNENFLYYEDIDAEKIKFQEKHLQKTSSLDGGLIEETSDSGLDKLKKLRDIKEK